MKDEIPFNFILKLGSEAIHTKFVTPHLVEMFVLILGEKITCVVIKRRGRRQSREIDVSVEMKAFLQLIPTIENWREMTTKHTRLLVH